MYISDSGIVNVTTSPNIAIIKYWGKINIQEPINPSISFTLSECKTETSIAYQLCKSEKADRQFIFQNERNTHFEQKLIKYLDSLTVFLPWLPDFNLKVTSKNNFPHSSGIASSASGFSAIAKAIADIHEKVSGKDLSVEDISNMARLGSGSACRSIENGWNVWGKNNILQKGNQHYAININSYIHPIFTSICDSVLIVKQHEKKVSSSIGHQLMTNHPYKEGRIRQAHQNMEYLLKALEKGDIKNFLEIAEEEALSLHGLMLSSNPGYTLLVSNSLAIIKKIREFRLSNQIDIGFTIDAGPNIHVLYFEKDSDIVLNFIQSELFSLCNNLAIHDHIQFD